MNVVPKDVKQPQGGAELCSRPAVGELQTASGTQSVTWQLPEEVPVALQINSEPYTVMMSTPADLRDFAVGFLVGEGIVPDPSKIQGILVMPVEGGMAIDVAVPETAIETSRLARRTMEARTGCGLCGVEDIESAVRPLQQLGRTWSPSPDAIRRAERDLFDHQPMNRFNRSVHGAAWVSKDGEIRFVREDVGRHNALDKLIGALYTQGIDRTDGFVLMTSRCSFELVQKSVTAGIQALVTVSAPTVLALELAKKADLFLASRGPGGPVVFHS
ncbi:formate dehydrogenase accessory sulfurtransferase FdhD [Hyphomicrobium facile]|uniref:Sulfur carrier protein FdhD n=1 Tax=Hyphomicrobium facile TaxID=51670 RepID=A0A1I7MZ57_9HYPH|nr:formate dehydrogenase accessory sulfurtransferase FdhD [Hyphomicrobium facile]SFV27707.1 FdhD protein [Hyphomicrobium facile]